MAYEIAVLAVIDLEDGLLIKGYRKGELSEVLAGPYHIKLYGKHLSFSQGKYDDSGYLSFEIEEKLYGSSAHCSKISFYSPEYKDETTEVESKYGFMTNPVDHERTDAEKQRRQNKIDAFLEQLMKDADMKIEPRFSLSEL